MNLNFLITGLMGYILVIFRDIPINMARMLKTCFISSITVNSMNAQVYIKLNEYLLSLNKKCFNNNLEVELYNLTKSTDDTVPSINYGYYVCKVDMLTFMFVSKTLHDRTSYISSSVKVTVFGLRRKKVLDYIINLISDTKEPNTIRVYSSNDVYDSGKDVLAKNIEDVFIMDKEYIVNTINKWKDNDKLFIEKGIIHKLGILLYGKPGTGKTTLTRAIANYLGYGVYVINLSTYGKDKEKLMERLNAIGKKNVVLFEDIDCLIGDRNVNDGKDHSLLNIVLNFIDGVQSPSDCVIIATTNHIDRLDEAFTRPGRFDVKMEMKYFDTKIAEEMCNSFGFKLSEIYTTIPSEISPAELQNKLISKVYES